MKLATAAAAIALFAASQASAADICSQTTIVATAAMAPDPDGFALIPATLGTAQETMAVNTGAEISELTQDTVARLHLKIIQNQFGMYNASGNFSEKAAAVSPFGIGNVSTKSYAFRIALSAPGGAAGTIAADVLRAYDVDFDFGGGKVNLVSPDHCVGKVITWQTSAVAVVAMTVTPEGRIVLPLTVDGHSLMAVLDTGSATSSITQSAAHSIGAASASTGSEQQFQAVALDAISVTNPKFNVVTRLIDSTNKPLDASNGADMTLGLNVLKHLHLYVAYHERRLYITPK